MLENVVHERASSKVKDTHSVSFITVRMEEKVFSLSLSLSLNRPSIISVKLFNSFLVSLKIMFSSLSMYCLCRAVASNFSKIFGMVQVLALILAPMAGLVMDHQVNSAAKFSDPFTRKLKQIQSGFWPMLFTTLTLAAILVCRFFNSTTAVYTSILFITLLRSFLVAVASAYLRIR